MAAAMFCLEYRRSIVISITRQWVIKIVKLSDTREIEFLSSFFYYVDLKNLSSDSCSSAADIF